MSELLKSIQADCLKARMAKDSTKAALLTTLISDVAMVAKNDKNREPVDGDVLKVIAKFINGITDTLSVVGLPPEKKALATLEKQVLESYLPRKVTGEELEQEVLKIVGALAEKTPKSLGVAMKALKETGLFYDGNEAKDLIQKALAA